MKTATALALSLLMSMFLAGCGDDGGGSGPSNSEPALSSDGGSSGSSGADLSSDDEGCPDGEGCSSEEEDAGDSSSSRKKRSSSSSATTSSSAAGHAPTLAEDTEGLTCGDDAELVAGTVDAGNSYVCDGGSFRAATDLEKTVGAGCTSYNRNEERLVAGWMKCDASGKWTVPQYRPALDSIVDSRDGRQYRTAGIGTQTWLAENLDYSDSVATPALRGASWCYHDTAEYCAQYGRLYTWGVAMDSATTGCGDGKSCSASRPRGICPEGWHLPDSSEWNVLIDAVGGASIAGNRLKAVQGSGWKDWGIDDLGFTMLPNSWRTASGSPRTFGDAAFWSSSEADTAKARFFLFPMNSKNVNPRDDRKASGMSVRCVKN